MATRTRLPRKAAQAISYVAHEDPLDEEEEQFEDGDEDEVGSKRRNKGKQVSKRRKVEVEESDEDEEEVEVEHAGEGVDFSKILPVELLNEIMTYLRPGSLYFLSLTSKTFHKVLTSKASMSIWREVMGIEKIPQLGGEEVHPTKLCAFLTDETCQYCGDEIDAPDRFLLLRLCNDCRVKNLVNIADVGPGKKYADFHPAVVACIVGTYLPPSNPRVCRQAFYALYSDLQELDEVLEELQAEDERAVIKLGTAAGPDAGVVDKLSSKARKLRDDGSTDRAAVVEKEMDKQFGERVKDFVVAQRIVREEREQLANWIRRHAKDLQVEHTKEKAEAKMLAERSTRRRRSDLEERVLADGVFARDLQTDHYNSPFPFTYSLRSNSVPTCPARHAPANKLKDPLYRLLARLAAKGIYRRKRSQNDDSEDEYGHYVPPKKPKSITTAAWKLIVPVLRKLAKGTLEEEEVPPPQEPKPAPSKSRKKRSRRSRLRDRDFGPEDDILTETLSAIFFTSRHEFLKARLRKITDMQPSKAARQLIPNIAVFTQLPSVDSLCKNKNFGTSGKDDEDDIVLFKEKLDAILEEIGEYNLDVRLSAIKCTLSATTDTAREELDDLDPLDLLEEYDDEFFRRPSSWVCCKRCGKLGPFLDVYAHHQTCFPNVSHRVPVYLPVEVAVAASAVFELAEVDPDDSSVPTKDIDEAFKGGYLLWENKPKYKVPDELDWQSLIRKIHWLGWECDNRDEGLPAPIVVFKQYKPFRARRW
ncbi:hypothetical protein JCM8547_009225 [Rhodosporidiobolus lusitaniae]